MEALLVDGSYGEGGGQILRTALAFSVVTKRPVKVVNIRAGRRDPGLRPQHVASLTILHDVFGGDLTGASVGSTAVSFSPGSGSRSSHAADLKTAASTTLVFQTLIPAVAMAGSRLDIDLVGGTDVPWSPTFDYLSTVVRAGFALMGIKFDVSSSRRGYYPVGGGEVRASIEPCTKLSAVDLSSSPRDSPAAVTSRCGMLPRHVAQRQADSAVAALRSSAVAVGAVSVEEVQSRSPGSSVLITTLAPGRILGTDGIGARGKRAEEVGTETAQRHAAALRTNACVDANLADMMAPFLSLADGPSRLRVPEATKHLDTSLYVAKLFTGCRYSVRKDVAALLLEVSPGHADQHNA